MDLERWIKLAFWGLVALVFLAISSCSKDDDNGLDNIIGSWNADGGTAVVTQNGNESFNGEMTATGTMNFEADSTGNLDISLMFGGSESNISGGFQWIRNGSTIILNENTASELRFTRTRNDKDVQELEFTQEDAASNAIVDYVLRLRRQ